jgi:hypothetical protein
VSERVLERQWFSLNRGSLHVEWCSMVRSGADG